MKKQGSLRELRPQEMKAVSGGIEVIFHKTKNSIFLQFRLGHITPKG